MRFFPSKTVKFSLCKIFLGDLFGTFCNFLGMHYLFDRPSEVYGVALYNRLAVFLKMSCEFIGCVSQGSALCSPVPMFPGTDVPRTYVPRFFTLIVDLSINR